jgi:hypothetical protein
VGTGSGCDRREARMRVLRNGRLVKKTKTAATEFSRSFSSRSRWTREQLRQLGDVAGCEACGYQFEDTVYLSREFTDAD